MKNYYFLFTLIIATFICSCNRPYSLSTDKWTITFDETNKVVILTKDSTTIFDNLYASYKWEDKLVTSKEYTSAKTNIYSVQDEFGQAEVFEITYTSSGLPTLIQSFYTYPTLDYVLTDIKLKATGNEVSSNYMSPVGVEKVGPILPGGNNRVLFVPFDNDAWVRFKSHALTFDKLRSYEVTAYFDNETRKGLVVGSVEHDCWKTGIDMTNDDRNNLSSLICYGGVADKLTRDSKDHGALKGKEIKSPKMMIGFFDDWRVGMDEYGKVNAKTAPRKEWSKAVPFGWNSWGALQFDMRYRHAIEVSDFFRNNLQNNHFANSDKLVYIGLDSGWNSFTEEELKTFADKCKSNGQVAGIYWTPFTDWGKNPEKDVEDATEYKYKDIYLYAGGKPQEFDGAYAVDPTHPAIEKKMKKTSDLFKRCGFEYVKMDFMGHGAMEADGWYHKDIRTGIQGYNYGMQLLNKYFGDMFINLSISPIFPARYAQSRRIACDAWNKIKDTEYTMNAVSYGWWIDNVYQFNDADHVVLRDASEGENRARVTSAVITGLFIAGDDFSKTGPKQSKDRAMKFLTNEAVNAAATGKSFRPVEGSGENSENQFVYTNEFGVTYFAVFNYDEKNMVASIPLRRMGLRIDNVSKITELWSGVEQDKESSFTVPAKDVKLFKIE